MLKTKEFTKILLQINDVFDLIMQHLFVNECTREETELLFWAVDQTAEPLNAYLFTQKKKGLIISQHNIENCVTTLDGYMNENYKDRKYLKEDLFFSDLKGHIVVIWCICISECLDQNKGKLLLDMAFCKMAEVLREWCCELEGKNRECQDGKKLQIEPINNTDEIAQMILAEAAKKTCDYIEGLYDPVRISYINSLSGEYYEKSECKSNMIFLPAIKKKELNTSVLSYNFRQESGGNEIKFVLSNIRWIRKLSQMAQEKLYLVFWFNQNIGIYEVLGICEEDKLSGLLMKTDYKEIPYFRAKIKKHMQWDLFLGNTYMFSFKNGQYKIKCNMSQGYLEEKLKDTFGNGSYTSVIESIQRAKEQSHGTMLVILSNTDAQKEVKRLSKVRFGMPDEKPEVRTAAIKSLSAIDGSIFLDTDGRVHGIGMILDGDKKAEGNPARGARFNSAVKYRKYLKKKGMAGLLLIVSEDESIEILSTSSKSFLQKARNLWKH